ncbi:MAG: hypothetical protein Fur0032_06230 [Terrimicrobiaceae bacterium]
MLVDVEGKEWSQVGGSAWFAAFGAAAVCHVRLVAAIGRDFPEVALEKLRLAGVDLSGIHRDPDRNSFFWKARYGNHPDERETIALFPNVEDNFRPDLSACADRFLYLANCQPRLQNAALRQIPESTFVGLDTIDRWIRDQREELCEMLPRIDLFLINAYEAGLLAGPGSPEDCCRKILELGPRRCVLKMGSQGALVADPQGQMLFVPSRHVDHVRDATGAGDTFGGALFGTLASQAATITTESIARAAGKAAAVAAHRISRPGIDHLIGWSPAD